MQQSFSRQQRIQKKETFSRIFKTGKRHAEKNINLWVAEKNKLSPEGVKKEGPLLGISVSKKVKKNAAGRNLWKRRIREAFRAEKAHIEQNIAVFVQAKTSEAIPTVRELREQLFHAIKSEGTRKA